MTEILYPVGYKRQLVTLGRLEEIHGPGMHHEYRRRLFPWIRSKGGLIGIGDGDRPCPSDVSEASKRCESFHQYQRFASGLTVYAAVDLVARSSTGGNHRSPSWRETDDAEAYGVHAFIGEETPAPGDDEPWHMQCIEMRGFHTWVGRGRPDPVFFPLPIDPPQGGVTMNRTELAGEDGNGYRVKDTRDNGAPKISSRYQILISDPAAEGAIAATVNLTVTQPDAVGNLSAWGYGDNPGTSKINFAAGETIANEVLVRLSAFRTFEIHATCPLHLVVDAVAYWFE